MTRTLVNMLSVVAAMIVANATGNLTGDKWTYFNAMGYFWIIYALVIKANQFTDKNLCK